MPKDILSIVDGFMPSMSSIDTAAAFAALHQAHLRVLVLEEQVPTMASADPAGYGIALSVCAEQYESNLTAVRDHIAKAPVGIRLRSACQALSDLGRWAAREAKTCDLALIAGKPGWIEAKIRRRATEAAILKGGAPCLLHPADWKPARFGHALLGWNGSLEASRAARTLVGLLEPGATIDILLADEACADDEQERGTDIADYLAHHGFAVEIHVRDCEDRTVADLLESFAQFRGAKLLAIGAYAHSKFREALLGGVTTDLIEAQKLPVLMVH